MLKSLSLTTSAAALVLAVSAAPAAAAPVYWTDWLTVDSLQVDGTLQIGSSTLNVLSTSTSAYNFVQTNGGTNYWSPSAPYISTDVDNAPPASDLISLNAGGQITIEFSQPVTDPLIALVSWNGNIVEFGETIEVLSFGQGFWGNGTAVVNGAGTGFTGSGELHGVIRLPGTFTSFSFSHTSENWHGFTVGVADLAATSAVPLPASLAIALAGLAALGLAARRRTA